MRKHPLLAFATAVSSIPFTLFGTAGTVAAITTHTSSITAAAAASPASSSSARLHRRHHRRAHIATAASRRGRRNVVAHVTAQSLIKRGAKVKLFVPLGGAWAQLRNCESGGNYSENSGNGYYGAYQFSLVTWDALGLGGLPSETSAAAQDAAAVRLQIRAGWRSWPMCSWILNLS